MLRIHRRALPIAAATIVVLASIVAMPVSAGVPAVVDAIDDAYEVDEDANLEVQPPGVLANDLPSAELVCVTHFDSSGIAGAFGAPQTLDGSFTFAPSANFNGTTTFTYGIASKSGEPCSQTAEDTATVTITVNPVNDQPTAAADSFTALANRTLNVPAPGVLVNDSDVDGDTLTATKMSNPGHGIVTLASDGAFSYTPTAGYTGPDAFSYRASDGQDVSATRIVTLTVTAVPTPVPPTPTPVPTPSPTPEVSAAPSESPSAEPSASFEASASAESSAGPSPGETSSPEPTDGPGGLSLPILIVGLLLISLLAFGGAVLVPKWWQARQGGPPLDDE